MLRGPPSTKRTAPLLPYRPPFRPDELLADAKKFGDDRRSPLVAREAAQALAETDLVASEPMTIVLSEKVWVRAAKGHDVDAATLSYRDGDGLLAAVRGRDRKSTRLNSSHSCATRMPSSARTK